MAWAAMLMVVKPASEQPQKQLKLLCCAFMPNYFNGSFCRAGGSRRRVSEAVC